MNSYYQGLINRLRAGEIVYHRGHGNSMMPLIKSGQLQTLEPVDKYTILVIGDIVLCKVGKSIYTHKITAISNDSKFQISNNKGHVNGWIGKSNIYGKVIDLEE